jgi:hypothetical protein
MCLVITERIAEPTDEEVQAWGVFTYQPFRGNRIYTADQHYPVFLDEWLTAEVRTIWVNNRYPSPNEDYESGFHKFVSREVAEKYFVSPDEVVIPVKLRRVKYRGVQLTGTGRHGASNYPELPALVADQMYISSADVEAAIKEREARHKPEDKVARP